MKSLTIFATTIVAVSNIYSLNAEGLPSGYAYYPFVSVYKDKDETVLEFPILKPMSSEMKSEIYANQTKKLENDLSIRKERAYRANESLRKANNRLDNSDMSRSNLRGAAGEGNLLERIVGTIAYPIANLDAQLAYDARERAEKELGVKHSEFEIARDVYQEQLILVEKAQLKSTNKIVVRVNKDGKISKIYDGMITTSTYNVNADGSCVGDANACGCTVKGKADEVGCVDISEAALFLQSNPENLAALSSLKLLQGGTPTRQEAKAKYLSEMNTSKVSYIAMKDLKRQKRLAEVIDEVSKKIDRTQPNNDLLSGNRGSEARFAVNTDESTANSPSSNGPEDLLNR